MHTGTIRGVRPFGKSPYTALQLEQLIDDLVRPITKFVVAQHPLIRDPVEVYALELSRSSSLTLNPIQVSFNLLYSAYFDLEFNLPRLARDLADHINGALIPGLSHEANIPSPKASVILSMGGSSSTVYYNAHGQSVHNSGLIRAEDHSHPDYPEQY